MGSNERSGAPLKGRDQAQAVWVDLAALFGRAEAWQPASSLIGRRPAACPLATDRGRRAWVGVATYVATLTDGTSIKYADQLVPARILAPR